MEQNGNSSIIALPEYSIKAGVAPVVAHTKWLGEGDFCSCYLVNDTYVFRFAKHRQASVAMEMEKCLLPVLNKFLSVEVPKIEFYGYCHKNRELMMGYTLVAGDSLQRNLLQHLPEKSRTRIITGMADFIRQLHQLPVQLFSNCCIPNLNLLQHFSGIMSRARQQLKPHLSGQVWQYYQDLLESYLQKADLHSYQPVLLHGDLSPDHFLVSYPEAKLTGIIDFGDACLSDPAWDLIYIYEDLGIDILQIFLRHYDPIRADLLAQKVQLYTHMNNVAYCLRILASGDKHRIEESMVILKTQSLNGW